MFLVIVSSRAGMGANKAKFHPVLTGGANKSRVEGCDRTCSVEFRLVAVAREAGPAGSLSEAREEGLDREDLLQIYKNMLITRGIEERGHILYRQGKIPGSFYTGRGNEGASVGIATAMGSDDVGMILQRR